MERKEMTAEEYYGDALPVLEETEKYLADMIKTYPIHETIEGVEPIIYCKSRIKSPDSMIRKLKKQGLPTDRDTALKEMHDTIGIRVICSFVDNVYEVAKWIEEKEEFELVTKKDYISWPKPNGYRSLHLILKMKEGAAEGMQVEVQLRTIAIDFWAALEHQIKYKHDVAHEKTIREELKRCADEIASVDMSMQTIKDIIHDDRWK